MISSWMRWISFSRPTKLVSWMRRLFGTDSGLSASVTKPACLRASFASKKSRSAHEGSSSRCSAGINKAASVIWSGTRWFFSRRLIWESLYPTAIESSLCVSPVRRRRYLSSSPKEVKRSGETTGSCLTATCLEPFKASFTHIVGNLF